MCRLKLTIKNEQGEVLAQNENEGFVNLVYAGAYNPGDSITLSVSKAPAYLVIQLDDVMNPSFVYLKEREYTLVIPFGEKHVSYNPKSFSGELHVLRARAATEAEIAMRKNLAQNEYDCHENASCFPHAYANVETRGESVFAARNAIDGNILNNSHGEWPYESWGINRDPNAELTLDFGRPVNIEEIVLVTRADFPHDNWWKQATLTFSDGSSEIVTMEKSEKPHRFEIKKQGISWLKMSNMIKDETDPSPFPALSQILVFGKEAN